MKFKNFFGIIGLYFLFTNCIFAQGLSQPPRWGAIQGNITNQNDLATYITYQTIVIMTNGNITGNTVLSNLVVNGSINIFGGGNITTNLDLFGTIDPWSYTKTINSYNNSTILISRTDGKYIRIQPTNNYTLAFATNTYPANSIIEHAIELIPNGNSTTFDPITISTNSATNIIPGSAGVSISTNQSNLLIFMKCGGWQQFGMKGQ